MPTFYDDWLNMWDKSREEFNKARKWIHEEEVEYVETQQDAKVGLLVTPETGFRTWGSTSMISEIPVGAHTGTHKHGEEAIHIITGSGFSTVNGVRYNWEPFSTLLIPFGAVHQHFNTGDVPARYFSVMSPHLEFWCGMARFTQYDNWGKTTALPTVPVSENGFDDRGRRIVLKIGEAPTTMGAEGGPGLAPEDILEIDPEKPIVLGTIEGYAAAGIRPGLHNAGGVNFMRVGKDTNGWHPYEQEISSYLINEPHDEGGTHAHMEAHLYIIQGSGYSIVDGEKISWKEGTCFHVQGPQTKHQHINTSDVQSKQIRVAPGIRYFFEAMAKEEFPYLYYKVRPRLLREKAAAERERERERS
ncbi:MAG: cupin domain-containing protein [Dehalococcoidia bacterium]|nr:cupin domain-containing protein [Dehalococcoidia bacterium]